MDGWLDGGLGVRFDHVAHAAERIADLLPLYADVLGGRLVEGGTNPRYGYRAIKLGYADGSKVELLEPLPGSGFLDAFLARHPRGGLHHVTFVVADVRAAVRRAEERGLETIGVSLDDPDWHEAFLHPRVARGALVQLVWASGRPTAGMDPDLTLDALRAAA